MMRSATIACPTCGADRPAELTPAGFACAAHPDTVLWSGSVRIARPRFERADEALDAISAGMDRIARLLRERPNPHVRPAPPLPPAEGR